MHLGRKVTVCPKLATYRIPALKELIDTARMGFIFLTPFETLREEPFVFDHVLGYLGSPDPSKWCPPTECGVVVGIIKVARMWGIKPLLESLSSILEIPLEKPKFLMKMVQDKLRSVCVCLATEFSVCDAVELASFPGLPRFVFFSLRSV